MQTSSAHADRITQLLTRLDEATSRFTQRLERAGARAEQAESGWTPAQMAAHVAMVNDNFTSVIDGSAGVATEAAADFAERPWQEVATAIPEKFEAPSRFTPPPSISAAEAVGLVRDSAARLREALAGLSAEHGARCFTNRLVGTVTVYQAGEWAIAHIIRHNQQAKRALGD